MSTSRSLVLTLGPIAIVAASYCLASPHERDSDWPRALVKRFAAPVRKQLPQPAESPRPGSIEESCHKSEVQLRQQLPAGFQTIVKPPFVLAGDISIDRLSALHASVIGPVSRALTKTYFQDWKPKPMSIVVCSTEARFRSLANRWDGHLAAGYHGYYQRNKRRVLLDLEAGNGSLAHELTHALTHCDCEHLPEWFDEGLGALHEEAEFQDQGHQLVGLPNWRCHITQQALLRRRLPSLRELTDPIQFRTGDVAVNYAMSRSFCLFLQDRNVLIQAYRNLRARPSDDIYGLISLRKTLGLKNTDQMDTVFRRWLTKQSPPHFQPP